MKIFNPPSILHAVKHSAGMHKNTLFKGRSILAKMRKNESNARLFTREQWLTKSQVQSFFSRLAAMRRKDQGVIGISLDEEEDVQCVQENSRETRSGRQS